MQSNTSTDYLSAGSITWQKFREYIKKIFNLNDGQTANETEGMRSVRESITAAGAPFWCLKYLPACDYGNAEMQEIAIQILDNMQVFISQEGNLEEAMTNVLQLFSGRGKLRERMTKAFQDKSIMAKAFTAFLFAASPELQAITEKLSIQNENLRDKLFGVMQNAVYTWTEEQVKDKLAGVVSEYLYLDALNITMRNVYHSHEEAIRDLQNAFHHMCIAILAIEPLQMPWYEALTILRRVSQNGITHMTLAEREVEIQVLLAHGTNAWECVQDGKPVLQTMLEHMQLDCTPQELDAIYNGLQGASCDATTGQFEKDLQVQTAHISQSRNRNTLLERWKTLTSTESVQEWSNARGIPLLWVVPKDATKAIQTLILVQNHERTLDPDVLSAIQILDTIDPALLTDPAKAEEAFLVTIGKEYTSIFLEKKTEILTELKLKLGNNVSLWSVTDLITVQHTLQKYQVEKAKKEKLQHTQNRVRSMQETVLKDRVTAFLRTHPEYCDAFME